mmetsp:Transcript_10832/g.29166  ORF Transcript_10832/g.29166 Transcript_10832/m.29166 type:complete len:367 (-) Transcript_10832:181-1281(-)
MSFAHGPPQSCPVQASLPGRPQTSSNASPAQRMTNSPSATTTTSLTPVTSQCRSASRRRRGTTCSSLPVQLFSIGHAPRHHLVQLLGLRQQLKHALDVGDLLIALGGLPVLALVLGVLLIHGVRAGLALVVGVLLIALGVLPELASTTAGCQLLLHAIHLLCFRAARHRKRDATGAQHKCLLQVIATRDRFPFGVQAHCRIVGKPGAGGTDGRRSAPPSLSSTQSSRIHSPERDPEIEAVLRNVGPQDVLMWQQALGLMMRKTSAQRGLHLSTNGPLNGLETRLHLRLHEVFTPRCLAVPLNTLITLMVSAHCPQDRRYGGCNNLTAATTGSSAAGTRFDQFSKQGRSRDSRESGHTCPRRIHRCD